MSRVNKKYNLQIIDNYNILAFKLKIYFIKDNYNYQNQNER